MVRWRFMLIGILAAAAVLFAAEGDTHTFELTWQANGESAGFSQAFEDTPSFDKEPPLEGHAVYRSRLRFDGPTDDADAVGVLWDKTDGKLYVDLNKDGDLTNDPNGILEKDQHSYSEYQRFPAFPLSFSTDKGVFRYRVAAEMQGYEFARQATFRVHSGYVGPVELYGRQWTFGANDKLQGAVPSGSHLSVYPRQDDFQNQISSQPLTKRLFLDGRCYEPAFEFRKSETDYPVLWCTLTERTVPLAQLKVEGQWISQLVLGNDEMLVLPALTEAAVPVPAMQLAVKACDLKYAEGKPAISPTARTMPSVNVDEDQTAVLKIGGPLHNSVDIERNGRTLTFNYTLVGVGGEKYDAQQVTGYNTDKKPTVAIYQGDMQVGSGNFEYG